MKKLVASNQKGGVGKSAIICQLAHYLSSLKFRVVVIDMDHQCNTSKSLAIGGVEIATVSAFDILVNDNQTIAPSSNFVLVKGTPALSMLEKKADLHNQYANNYLKFLNNIDSMFDICLIDTNPNPDIRQLSSLLLSDFVVSPIQLNQEAVDGIGGLLKQINAIKKSLNPNLKLLGILPNMVEPTPFHKQNLLDIKSHYADRLISIGSDYAVIKKSTAIAEAQARGMPTNKLGKTSGYSCWSELKPVFNSLIDIMQLKK